MRIINKLLKNYFLRVTKLNEFKYNLRNKNEILRYVLVIVSFLGLGVAWIYKAYDMIRMFADKNTYLNYILFPLILASILFTVFSIAIKGVGTIYFGKDINIFFSFPVRLYQIILPKVIVFYFYIAFINLIIIYPIVLFYGIFNNVPILYYFVNAVNVLLLPTIPIIIGIFVGVAIYRFIRGLRVGNSKIKAIAEVFLLIAFICFVIYSDSYKNLVVEIFSHIQTKSNFFIELIDKLFITHNRIVLYTWLAVVGVSTAGLYIITQSFKKVYFALSSNRIKYTNLKLDRIKKRTVLHSLFLREKERYFSLPVYVLNTMLGIILLFIYIFLLLFSHKLLDSYIMLVLNSFDGNTIPIGIINACIITVCIMLTNITSSSISIEGKKRLMLKIYPIKATTFFETKIFFQLFLTVPIIIATNTIAIVVFRMNFQESLIGYFLPISFTIFSSLMGCFLNICFPSYNWENVAFIVKQSIAAILSVFMSVGITVLCFFIVFKYWAGNTFLGLCVVILVINFFNVLMMILFKRKSNVFFGVIK